ncbi:MAG: MotA/TolQ/ExbB proton channel family protein, partial [Planctomycetales bacterium]|nr:MotA/TolQ/ExbB proton channel family protein [Planctomycetales bacterium]
QCNGRLSIVAAALLLFAGTWVAILPAAARAQETEQSDPNAMLDSAELQRLAAEAASGRGAPPLPQVNSLQGGNLNILDLLLQGGGIMAVIAGISLLVLSVALERMFSLRRSKLYPAALRRELRRAREGDTWAPEDLFRTTQRYRCAASRILRDMLQKLGRPIPEVEMAINEATQREADRLYGNVRWLTLAAAVTPLIGLLGTVWGMILAFHDTTQLGAGSNKAEFLAEGIYIALVTTLGGLAVAIPSAIFAHYFEGRITKMLGLVDGELRNLIPRFEAVEGRERYDITSQGLVPRTKAVDAQRLPSNAGHASSPPPVARPG